MHNIINIAKSLAGSEGYLGSLSLMESDGACSIVTTLALPVQPLPPHLFIYSLFHSRSILVLCCPGGQTRACVMHIMLSQQKKNSP